MNGRLMSRYGVEWNPTKHVDSGPLSAHWGRKGVVQWLADWSPVSFLHSRTPLQEQQPLQTPSGFKGESGSTSRLRKLEDGR